MVGSKSCMRLRAVIALVACVGAVSACTPSDETGRVGPVTTQQIPEDVRPPLLEVPAEPRDTIEMLPAPDEPSDAVIEWLEGYRGYVDGSGRVEAIYAGNDGPHAIIKFQANDPNLGRVGCIAVAPLGSAPLSTGCGSPDVPPSGEIVGMFSRQGAGDQEVWIEHSPDAEAVVIELAGGGAFVIRPNDSTVSFHRWVGGPPIRTTVFWPDGTTSQEIMSR